MMQCSSGKWPSWAEPDSTKETPGPARNWRSASDTASWRARWRWAAVAQRGGAWSWWKLEPRGMGFSCRSGGRRQQAGGGHQHKGAAAPPPGVLLLLQDGSSGSRLDRRVILNRDSRYRGEERGDRRGTQVPEMRKG